MKKVMVDELHRAPSYVQYTAIFDCGCSYANASWASKEQCIAVCPDHDQPKAAIHTHLTSGVRPENAETLKSSVKVNLSALKESGEEAL
ncbi:hypothetical protein ACOJUY_004323 [Vibrio alginolyticus]|nr:hypothetical protein [Vibrio parahaemolyticus]EHA1078691.1 hypothetical protein [Vibrio alginolyticus]EHA1137131.1 hypothetical protein [Vibrio alginolyticus]MBM5100485.1 hypothetical protein [Vibrio parahaemolyticus]